MISPYVTPYIYPTIEVSANIAGDKKLISFYQVE